MLNISVCSPAQILHLRMTEVPLALPWCPAKSCSFNRAMFKGVLCQLGCQRSLSRSKLQDVQRSAAVPVDDCVVTSMICPQFHFVPFIPSLSHPPFSNTLLFKPMHNHLVAPRPCACGWFTHPGLGLIKGLVPANQVSHVCNRRSHAHHAICTLPCANVQHHPVTRLRHKLEPV